MVSVEQANEIVAKQRELETEQKLTKDLFNRALRTSQTGGDGKLNFGPEYTYYIFKMEVCMRRLR